MSSVVRIVLTSEQRTYIRQQTGFQSETWEWPRAQFVAASLLAHRIGYAGIPHGRTATESMLSGRFQLERFLELTLTPEQQLDLGQWAGRSLSAICFCPDDYIIRYHEAWQDAHLAMPIGSRLLILDEEEQIAPTNRLLIRLASQAGMKSETFGTGRHPATVLALELMETLALAGKRTLDIGTGSGILSVAAARLGSSSVEAYDIDENAVGVARETAMRNGLAGQISVFHGKWQLGSGRYDLATANVFPNVLVELAPALGVAIAPKGFCVASGIVRARAPGVEAAFLAAGFETIMEKENKNWVALLFSRRTS